MKFKLLGRVGKRRRFIFGSLFLSLAVVFATFLNLTQSILVSIPLVVLVYLVTFFAILEGIDRLEWLMLFLHPVYFTISLYLFVVFLLPVRWLTRLPYLTVYAISIYAILLSSNIFNVGAIKNLQLFRAAFSVNFLFLTISSFLIYNLVLSFKLNFILNFIFLVLSTFPLAWQFLWSVNPSTELERGLVKGALLIALIIGEAGIALSFIPIRPIIFALFLTTLFYCLLGLFQSYMSDRLFKERIREYVIVIVCVSIITFLSIGW